MTAACGPDRPPPAAPTASRWEAVEALAETDCEPWPDDRFPTDIAPDARREALRRWHAESPQVDVEVDARYVTFSYVDRTEPADLPVVAHLVASLRRCGRWADRRAEEELLARACAVEPASVRDATRDLPPPPPDEVSAAREALWLDDHAPPVSGRFTAALRTATQDWLAGWVLDQKGSAPGVPTNLPVGHLLREETRPPPPDVPPRVARCTAEAPATGPFRVPAAGAAGMWVPDPAGLRLWWPEDGVLGSDGPLGPVDGWFEGSRRTLTVGRLERVEPCPGQVRWEAVVPLGDGGPGSVSGVALPPGADPEGWSVVGEGCRAAVEGPGARWAPGCCPGAP